jgi:3-dehydroquinate dehydratase/shikimate dehydrogenase
MLSTVIIGPSFEEAKNQIDVSKSFCQMFEFRLDLFDSLENESLKQLLKLAEFPVIFTLRPTVKRSEEQRLTQITSLLSLKPAYFDLESEVPPDFFLFCKKNHPEVDLIASTHDYEGGVELLEEYWLSLKKLPADHFKIAVKTKSTLEALQLLLFQKKYNVIAIGMGLEGHITRILGKKFGRKWTYASLEDGEMLSARTLEETYGYSRQNHSTDLYGLIGDPVTKSPSHLTHNEVMRSMRMNACYVKMPVTPDELPETFHLLKTIGFKGLSVTMPHKEKIVPLLDVIEPRACQVGAVNTVRFCDNKAYGYNTDSLGALEAIEEVLNVTGKKIVLLGLGGASKAIAYEANKRGASVSFVRRGEMVPSAYDILINCTPNPLPVEPIHLISGALLMDITFRSPHESTLLTQGQQKGCRGISAERMFFYQAAHQFRLWLS